MTDILTKKFQFELAIAGLGVQPLYNVWISEVTVREGAKFLGFGQWSSIFAGTQQDYTPTLSVAQTIYGHTKTWYLLTYRGIVSETLINALTKLALGVWNLSSHQQHTFVIPDLATLETAIELLPAPDKNYSSMLVHR